MSRAKRRCRWDRFHNGVVIATVGDHDAPEFGTSRHVVQRGLLYL